MQAATWHLDVRYAARTLRRSPRFTALVVLTLAVGIGATTALFSLVDAVLLRPLPFKDPHQLVEIWGRNAQRTGMRVPGETLAALRTRARTLQAVGTHDPSGGVLIGDTPIQIFGETVSANFVDVFGVQPMAGRAFVPDDERPGAPAVMLVSFAFWQQHLGADANAVGRTMYLDSVPYGIVGVMPRGFRTTFLARAPAFWTPFAGSRSREREREMGYEVVARLAPGVSVDDARREIAAMTGPGIGLVSLRDEVVGDRAYALQLLLVAAALVLAVACANVAQLLLARTDQRIKEFATRKAIGASGGQVLRLALVESLLLAIAGGAAGVVLAYWLVPVMLALAPVEIPRLAEASVDGRVLVAALAISILTGGLFGLAPSLRLSRLSVVEAMKPVAGAPSKPRARFRSALVVVQVAAAVIMFALAGLVVQTFLTLLPSSPGFATESRVVVSWFLRQDQFPDVADRRRRVADWMERLEAVPGIASAAVGSNIPFGDDETPQTPVRLPGDMSAAKDVALRAEVRAVTANFFQLLEIPVIQGRGFAAADRAETARVAVVNQTLARRLDPAGNVIGRSIRVGSAVTSPIYDVVGVVAEMRWWGMTREPRNEVYTPLAQDRASYGWAIVHSPVDPDALTNAIRTTFHAAFPGAPLSADLRARPFDDLIADSVAGPRFGATLIGSFSITAFVLAVTGVFGLVTYSLSQRRQEFGIRVALGARAGDLVAMGMRSAIALTAMGVASGLVAAAYLTRFIASQLYAIEPTDPLTFAAASLAMIVAAAAAAYVPARQAAHRDPIDALRYE